jgi:hypothetical protein
VREPIDEIMVDAKKVIERCRDDVEAEEKHPELLKPPFHRKALPTGVNRLSFEGLYKLQWC